MKCNRGSCAKLLQPCHIENIAYGYPNGRKEWMEVNYCSTCEKLEIVFGGPFTNTRPPEIPLDQDHVKFKPYWHGEMLFSRQYPEEYKKFVEQANGQT